MKKENTTKEKSLHQLKVESNRKFKDIFKVSGLQNYAIQVWEKPAINPSFIELCKRLNLKQSDMKFKIVLEHGTVKELHHKNKETGKFDVSREYFSFWVMQNCLIRYARSIGNIDKKTETVMIKEVKESAKTTKTTKSAKKKAA